jgi:hypothetical protein
MYRDKSRILQKVQKTNYNLKFPPKKASLDASDRDNKIKQRQERTGSMAK